MGKSVLLKDDEGREIYFDIANYPDKCPICSQGIASIFVTGYIDDSLFVQKRLELIFQCPLNKCHHLFIAYYDLNRNQYSRKDIYYLSNLTPINYQPNNFGEDINRISKDFERIFNQAEHAESIGLDDISGPGYRKALEFLIKDYAILRNPEKSEVIKKLFLGQIIKDYIADSRIKSTAKRAAWLGNDETHYYRKWNDKEIEDLKVLIKLTIFWIESEQLTQDYETDMVD